MPKARALLTQPPDAPPTAMKPHYPIRKGDKILFVVLSEYHPWVVEAFTRAILERGARVDLYTIDSTPLSQDPEEIATHEALSIGKDEGDYNYFYTMITNHIRTDTSNILVKLEGYDMVIAGTAPFLPPVSYPVCRYMYGTLEDFISPEFTFPFELQKLIDDKVFAQIMACESLRLTDPEGTDVRWTNYNDGRPYYLNHQLARPIHTGVGFGGKDDCEGVVAGTANHLSVFPHAKAYIKRGQVVRVEGGGKYGEAWRRKLEEYKDVEFPPLPKAKSLITGLSSDKPEYEVPEPGLFWYMECAIGTCPGVVKPAKASMFQQFANCLHDRKRAGYIHNGFGSPGAFLGQPHLIRAKVPWAHVHIHSIFATLKGETKKGESITIIDKGHLRALDDPEVRSKAAKFGNSDEILNEAWFQGIPGINVLGNYMEDFGKNPASWIRREIQGHPVWEE